MTRTCTSTSILLQRIADRSILTEELPASPTQCLLSHTSSLPCKSSSSNIHRRQQSTPRTCGNLNLALQAESTARVLHNRARARPRSIQQTCGNLYPVLQAESTANRLLIRAGAHPQSRSRPKVTICPNIHQTCRIHQPKAIHPSAPATLPTNGTAKSRKPGETARTTTPPALQPRRRKSASAKRTNSQQQNAGNASESKRSPSKKKALG